MFRIRRIYDDHLPINRAAILQVQAILRAQFPLLHESVILEIPHRLRNPMKYGFRSTLFVAEGGKTQIKGFAFLLYDPDLDFCYLDFLASARHIVDRGIGGSLYERVRQEALSLESMGIFYECLPDDMKLCSSEESHKQNSSRLRFYERYGARPIVNTAYETPVTPGSLEPPYLVFDDLGQHRMPNRDEARAIVRAILEREYHQICSPEYVDTVVESFRDPVIQLREPKYRIKETLSTVRPSIPKDAQIALVINDRHGVHDVRERGYVEAPVRITSILKEISETELFLTTPPKNYPISKIKSVHDGDFVRYLKKVCESVPEGRSVYPYVFPIRNATRPPKDLAVRAGYYCIDTFTPLNRRAYAAAERAVDCALTAADAVLDGRPIAYALVRPPGHHAERRSFGGFCYFNSTAIAAHHLSDFGRVAILDIDYHHGNGQQDIFYERSDVLTISIHGQPQIAYPYFSGFEDEKGVSHGEGFNVNFPLPEFVNGLQYREVLRKALRLIKSFDPTFLVVALGIDTAKGDPTGSWSLRANDFEANGALLGELKLPTLVIQEGGYNTRNLGINVRRFFWGLWTAIHESRVKEMPHGSAKSPPETKGAKPVVPLPESPPHGPIVAPEEREEENGAS